MALPHPSRRLSLTPDIVFIAYCMIAQALAERREECCERNLSPRYVQRTLAATAPLAA